MSLFEIVLTVGTIIGIVLYILLRFDKNLKDKKT